MYYLRQHQFSQLALFTVQILLCLFMGKAMVQHLWLLSTVEGPTGHVHNKQVAGFTVATFSLPVKLYPWDYSEFMVSPSHSDACRCVKPYQQEEKKE